MSQKRMHLGWKKCRIAALGGALLLTSCVHQLTMHARDGEKLSGRWRFAREGTALVQVFRPDGEILVGMLKPVARGVFFASYQQTFGRGAIDAAGPDFAAFGNSFWFPPGSSNALADVVYGESFNAAAKDSARVVSGPLFFWTASLQGDRRTFMQCFLIGSSRSASGLGRCKGTAGKEYTVEF